MRVLHVVPYFAPAFKYGGPPRTVLGLCHALQRIGVDVEVFTTTANGQSDFPISPLQGDVYEGVRVCYFPRRFPKKFFRAAGLGARLSTSVVDYDLIHIHGIWNFTGWSAVRSVRRSTVPYIISPRGMLDPACFAHQNWRKRVAYHLIERSNLESAARLHATSSSELSNLAAYGFAEKTFLLPNGFDMPTEMPARGSFRRQLNVSDSAPLVTYLGRIHPIKRLDLLAAAFARLHSRYPEAHLVIAGPDDEGCRRTIHSLFQPFAPAMTWAGELGTNDKWALLHDSTVLMMCSDSESFGVSVVEAMAAGIPVIVTRSCPWQEVENVGCGFWVEQDPAVMSTALEWIVGNPIQAAEMGSRGKALAHQKYEWGAIGAAMVEHYREALSGRRA